MEMKRLRRLSVLTASCAGLGASCFGQCDDLKVLASDGAPFDSFGFSVAIDGGVAIVGARNDDDSAGSAYVYRWDGSTWTMEQKLTAADRQPLDGFGISVAIDGDTAVVGAGFNGDNGAAYVFRWNGATWVEEQKLRAGDGEAGDGFGISVSLSGDGALVGAPYDDDAGPASGAAYVFRWTGEQWVEQQKLTASDGAKEDDFGDRVSIDGDIAVVAAPFDDDEGPFTGSAYVFRFDGELWNEETKLVASDATAGAEFGRGVSLSGRTLIVGAHLDDATDRDSGSAYVFRWSGSEWGEEQKLLASDAGERHNFGFSVSIDGNLAVVGAYGHDESAGAAYVYRHVGETWVEEERLTASDRQPFDNLGLSTALAGTAAIAGALNDDDNGSNAGSAYLYDLGACLCLADVDGNGAVDFDDLLRILDAWGNEGGPEDLDGSGVVDFQDIVLVLAAWGPCK